MPYTFADKLNSRRYHRWRGIVARRAENPVRAEATGAELAEAHARYEHDLKADPSIADDPARADDQARSDHHLETT